MSDMLKIIIKIHSAPHGQSLKVSMSALIGISIEKGEIESLDDPVYKYLPVYKGDERSVITLRNILDMESGLQYPETQHETMFLDQDQLQYALNVPLEKKPDQNGNTTMLIQCYWRLS